MKLILLDPINTLSTKEHREELYKLNNNHNPGGFIDYEFQINNVQILERIMRDTHAKIALCGRDRCCTTKTAEVIRKITNKGFQGFAYYYKAGLKGKAGETKQQAVERFFSSIREPVKYMIIDSIYNSDKTTYSNVIYTEEDGLYKIVHIKLFELLRNLNNKNISIFNLKIN